MQQANIDWKKRKAIVDATHRKTYQEIAEKEVFSSIREKIEQWIHTHHCQAQAESAHSSFLFEDAKGNVFSPSSRDISEQGFPYILGKVRPLYLFSYWNIINGDEKKPIFVRNNSGQVLLWKQPEPTKQDIANGQLYYRLGARQDFLLFLEKLMKEHEISLA